VLVLSVTALASASLAGCSLHSLTDVGNPTSIISPGTVATQSGAVQQYVGALNMFARSYAYNSPNYTSLNGLLADEFTDNTTAINYRSADGTSEDANNGPFGTMSTARLNLTQAIYGLQQYGKTTPKSYIGELYALRGYVYLQIAELYCSGIPFSQVSSTGGITLGQPETSEQMYNDAIAQFDSAITITTDSAVIKNLATVGKARALLDLGQFADAATTAAAVPVGFSYAVAYSSTLFPNYWSQQSTALFASISVANQEGQHGLNFSTAADPRVPVTAHGTIVVGTPAYLPAKYIVAGNQPVPLATGIEAQLIVAEAALKQNDPSWLSTLNALRTTCTTTGGCATPAPAGTGGVAGLPPLSDPGTDTGRVSLVFRERAFWLFATGHRTGDLRRLIRQYNRPSETVFPIGTNIWGSALFPAYGSEVNLQPPNNEQLNANYNGCINRDA
jgi:hypothetical protein